ncbi:MAG: T9SS type A sorting domain-containing protein [Chitinophagales bacterium]
MKFNYFLLGFLVAGLHITSYAQTYQLTVNNGYGSGNYHAGDTVQVWSAALDSTKVFDRWTGNTASMQNPLEWHSTLVMPASNITITAQLQAVALPPIQYEKIMGVSFLKNVYSCFPPNMRGVIYLLHGTGGSASNWMQFTEYRNFVNAALADSFGVLITEAEEITRNTDLNGDGKLRWQPVPLDTLSNIDYQNLKILTDTFIARQQMTTSTPKFSLGMSNGGAFSGALSYIYNYRAGISYCASAAKLIFGVRTNPFAFRMAKYDDNAEVGPQGNEDARQNDSVLAARGVCHDYLIHDRQPVYPERFARVPGVSVNVSQTIFNELVAAQLLDSNHYAKHSDTISNYVLGHLSQFPTVIGLSNTAKADVINQIAASNAEHKFYSDYTKASLDFFKTLCTTTGIQENDRHWSFYPNPANAVLTVFGFEPGDIGRNVRVYNSLGQIIRLQKIDGPQLDLNTSLLPEGNYFLEVDGKGARMFCVAKY